MEKKCSNCAYCDADFHEEPCVYCRGTAMPGTEEYRTRPYYWEEKNNPVNHPSHYNKGNIEVADFIADQKLNFDRDNAVKYVCRAGSKDPEKEIQDLEKAIWYINHEIKILKGDIENGTET